MESKYVISDFLYVKNGVKPSGLPDMVCTPCVSHLPLHALLPVQVLETLSPPGVREGAFARLLETVGSGLCVKRGGSRRDASPVANKDGPSDLGAEMRGQWNR